MMYNEYICGSDVGKRNERKFSYSTVNPGLLSI